MGFISLKNKALCYNCLYKLNDSDISNKVCPKCNMKINKDGLPLKGNSNYAWKISDTGNDEEDIKANKDRAIDQGFHFGNISRLRYGITEGNTDNWIINPDKSFNYGFNLSLAVVTIGWIGCQIDSLLGAWFENRGLLTKGGVNALAITSGMLIMLAWLSWF